MLSSIAGHDVAWSVAEAIHRQTEGNPLFIQEVVRYLVEEGLLDKETGRQGGQHLTSLTMSIPEGLRDVIGRRLARLSPECNRLLSAAAVIGRDFALETLQAVANQPEEQVLAGIEEAVRVGVLEDQSRSGAIRYRFAHAFFRQTLYEEMIAPRRIRYHQQIARALEAQYSPFPRREGGEGVRSGGGGERPSRLEEHAAELAEHFGQSSNPEDLQKAVRYCELGAERAMAVYAYSEAVRLLEEALEVQEVVAPDEKVRQCDLLLALGEALMPAGDSKRVLEEVAEHALTLAETLGESKKASQASLLALEAIRRYRGVMGMFVGEAQSSTRRWIALADRHARYGTTERVMTDAYLGRLSWYLGERGNVLLYYERAIDVARRLSDPDALYWVILAAIQMRSTEEDDERRLRIAEEFAGGSQNDVHAGNWIHMAWRSGEILLDCGKREKTEELQHRMEAVGRETRDPEVSLWAGFGATALAIIDGRLETALDMVLRLRAQANEQGHPGFGTGATLVMLSQRALLHLGRSDEALATLDGLQSSIGDLPSLQNRGWRSLELMQLGRRSEAQTALQGGLDSLHAMPERVFNRAALAVLLEAATVLKDLAAVKVLVPYVEPFVARSIVGYWEFTCVARHLGTAAVLLGDRVQARRYYEQALEVCARVRFRPEIALTRLQMAELCLEEITSPSGPLWVDGEGVAAAGGEVSALLQEAQDHLDFCIPEFRDMKMQPSLERAEALRARLASGLLSGTIEPDASGEVRT